ncbi:MAG: type I restriction enzyme HsdR N-terminal domain-containing protein [Methanomassiliicoccales archaeon]|nr:MAG: type I restriction enzyme HsdR N-terminal domain-containing protein [Methanomassiliicoccales archaeon]QLH74556.1 MAG: type I restriction enzyme HsdR N-terminal domain-containing protein [Methanomassiliicoccales archaeon]
MGKIFDTFGTLTYANEAEVSQNFIIPLLTELLGYSREDIKPEKEYPVFKINYGRRSFSSDKLPKSQKPDYVVCNGTTDKPKFVVESKGPEEKLDNHLKQMTSYAIGVGVNFIVMTNGKSLMVNDVNEPIFFAETMEDLDIKSEILIHILSKDIQTTKKHAEIIQTINLKESLGMMYAGDDASFLKLQLSDFLSYLKKINEDLFDWQVPFEMESGIGQNIEQYPPEKMLQFRRKGLEGGIKDNTEKISLLDLINKDYGKIRIIIGPSGIGKSTTLRYLAYQKSTECLRGQSPLIPVYIQLRRYGLNLNIRSLIKNSLEKYGMTPSDARFSEMLNKNMFLFLFDGFDEIEEKYVIDAIHEIEAISEVGNSRFIISSRDSRPPFLHNASTFIIEPLDDEVVLEISGLYFGAEKYSFYNEMARCGIGKDAHNTLILTFLALIFKEDKYLPSSRRKTIQRIIELMKLWEKGKDSRASNTIEWDIRKRILAELAYEIIDGEKGVTLSSSEIDKVLIPLIKELKDGCSIPADVDKRGILEDLSLIGLVNYENNSISFCHRIFLDYFASEAFANKYSSKLTILSTKISKIYWTPIIELAAGSIEDGGTYVIDIEKSHLFLAGRCAVEVNNIDDEICHRISLSLARKCSSLVTITRFRAMNILRRLQSTYSEEIFYKLFMDCEYTDVKMMALKQLNIIGSTRGQELLSQNIDLSGNGRLFFDQTIPGNIALSIAHNKEGDYLKIIEIWKREPDLFTSQNCKDAILIVLRSGHMTDGLKKALLEFYLEKGDIEKTSKDGGLATVLIEIGDASIVPSLVESLKDMQEDKTYGMYTNEILASFKDDKVVDYLIGQVTEKKSDKNIIVECAKALSQSKGRVPKDVFIKLLDSKEQLVRAYALDGLQRFPAPTIKEYLVGHIDDVWWAQREAIKVLAEKGMLLELTKQRDFLGNISQPAFEILLEKIEDSKAIEMLPVLNDLLNYCQQDRSIVRVSKTFCIIGEVTKAKSILNELITNKGTHMEMYALSDIVEIAPIFDQEYAIEMVKFTLASTIQDERYRLFLEHQCIESLEKIGGESSLVILKEIALKNVVSNGGIVTERALRAMNALISKKDEEWYSNFIESYPQLNDSAFRRAIEGLGLIGSKASITKIQEIAAKNKSNQLTIDFCYSAMENVYILNGEYIEISDEELFGRLV